MDIVVVGAGISGLSTAYYLRRLLPEAGVTVVEASDRVGGKIRSERVNGYLIEAGCNGFLDSKPHILELCEHLGVSQELMRANESSSRRFIYADGKLRELPTSLREFIYSDVVSWRAKLRMMLEVFTPPTDAEDETIASFAQRHLGEEALRRLIAPMVSGVFAGDAYKLSLRSTFPVMAELERLGGGSLIRGMLRRRKRGSGGPFGPGGVLTSFPEGMEYLPRKLAEVLGSSVLTRRKAESVERRGREYVVDLGSRGSIACDAVVLACPAYAAGKLVWGLSRALAEELGSIHYTKLAVVAFGYDKSELGQELDGFGFLVPHEEGRTILGCLWDSSMFEHRAPEGKALLRMMVGGARAESLAELEDTRLVEACRSDLKHIMGIEGEPELVRIYRYRKAIAQYNLGHQERLRRIDRLLERFPGLMLTGSAYRGVGVNDCVRQARECATELTRLLVREAPSPP